MDMGESLIRRMELSIWGTSKTENLSLEDSKNSKWKKSSNKTPPKVPPLWNNNLISN